MDIGELNLNLARGLPAQKRWMSSRTSVIWTPGPKSWPPRPTVGCQDSVAPAEFDGSLPKFRMLALVTVLQRNLGVRYDPACREGAYCAFDPRTLFLHGLLDGHGGTCATMPVLYVAIGRRLGYSRLRL